MALVGKRLATALDTHYRCRYERFHKRWKRVCLGTVDGQENGEHFLDPQETQLNELVRQAWFIRRDLEACGFTLFPETKTQVLYVTLDETCIAHLYRGLHPHSFTVRGKCPGTTRTKSISDVTADHTPEVFSDLFALTQIRRLRRSHQFRYSLQTDGVGVALNIGCLFLAQALGLGGQVGLWDRGTRDGMGKVGGHKEEIRTTILLWAEIFGHHGYPVPFSLPTAAPA